MTWRLPDTYHSAGTRRGTATLKFYEGRDILSSCPPTGSSLKGITPWDDTGAGGSGYFPVRSGQVLECGLAGSGSVANQPGYAWTFPSEDAFITALGAPNTTFAAHDSWWTNNSEPSAAPSPAASS